MLLSGSGSESKYRALHKKMRTKIDKPSFPLGQPGELRFPRSMPVDGEG